MDFNLVLILSCLSSILWVTSRATLSPEEYWKSEFPNITIPKPIKDILPSDTSEYRDIDHGVIGKEGLNDIDALYMYFAYHLEYVQKGIEPDAANASKPDQIPSFYFLLETDLHEGKTMTLDFPNKTNSATFLPRHVAELIPFSPDEIPEILDRFSIAHNSPEAKKIKTTMNFCYTPKIKAEKKLCATSLESMIDFVKAELGNSVAAIATEMDGQNCVQNYRITGEVRKLTVDDEKDLEVSCHKKNYVYAVFYCHMLRKTRAYVVPLVGEDGTKVNALAICHGDTSEMNPKFWAFRVLGIEPGIAPICHFIPRDHILFYN